METEGIESVIAVDDYSDNLDLVVRTLSEYRVHAFTTVGEALQKVNSIRPVVLVIDYRMPEMNGLKLLHRLRDLGEDSAALLVTAFPDLNEVVYAGQNSLVYQVVPKPFRPERLRDWVKLASIQTRILRRDSV